MHAYALYELTTHRRFASPPR